MLSLNAYIIDLALTMDVKVCPRREGVAKYLRPSSSMKDEIRIGFKNFQSWD